MISVQSATAATFDDIHRLLLGLGFEDSKRNKESWQQRVFQYSWKTEEASCVDRAANEGVRPAVVDVVWSAPMGPRQ